MSVYRYKARHNKAIGITFIGAILWGLWLLAYAGLL